jgi:protease-4
MKENFLRSLPEISFRRYLDDTVLNDGWPPEPKLAVVVAEGDIGLEKGPQFPFDNDGDVTPSAMEQAFKRAFSQPGVAGVIFRINSPGGYALAGEEIYHSAFKAAQEKFLVTSMSNVAASGGYYVTMPSARIFANPGTITGSVGIYGGKVDLSGLYETIDLGKELYLRGRFAYSHLKAFYDHFVQLVADNRSLPSDSVDALSRGKVWTGREALANGLIDEIGGLKRSFDYVAERLDLDNYRIAVYPEKRPWIILPGRSALSAVSRLFARKTDNGFSTADIFTGVPEEGGILARLPFDISIK